MNNKKIFNNVPIVLWLCLIFGHSLMPASISSEESGFFTDLVLKFIPILKTAENVDLLIRKAAHFTEFMILAILLSIRLYQLAESFLARFLIISASGLFAAFIDETIQLFVEGRAGMIADVWIDLAGVVTGCIIALNVIRIRKSRK